MVKFKPQGMEGGRWSPTSAQDQLGAEQKQQEEDEMEMNDGGHGLGIMGWVIQALALVLGLVISYIVLS